MNILICNVGSTSLKYQLFAMEKGEQVIASGGAERVGGRESCFYWTESGVKRQERLALPTHREAIERMLRQLPPEAAVDCVGFKVVHAKGVTGVQYLTEDVLQAMADFNSVAPAHNPPYIAAIRQFRELMPATPLIGSFETGFHSHMPPEAYLYPLPAQLCRDHAIRRYGFHGASHEYLTAWVSEAMGRKDLKLVSCHLGGSGSLCAIMDGKSMDTSFGLSLQCGLPQSNRAGDIDPYIIAYLVRDCGYTLDEVFSELEKKGGLLGISGVSNDLRDLEEAAPHNERAQLAIDIFIREIIRYIGGYAAILGGLDAIAFTGGIGENSETVRSRVLDAFAFMGLKKGETRPCAALDPSAGGKIITAPDSALHAFVIPANEELGIARKVFSKLQ